MIRTRRAFDPHTIKLAIFDLDGTLIDSRLDLVHSVNAALRHIGRPELPDDVVARYVEGCAHRRQRRGKGKASHDGSAVEQASRPLACHRRSAGAGAVLQAGLWWKQLCYQEAGPRRRG